MQRSFLRGNPIVWVDGQWVYEDTLESTADTHMDRPCGHCGQQSTDDDHDACLGTLPGVMNACCGHGVSDHAYVQYLDGTIVKGARARRELTPAEGEE